jgi:hypothetical protein
VGVSNKTTLPCRREAKELFFNAMCSLFPTKRLYPVVGKRIVATLQLYEIQGTPEFPTKRLYPVVGKNRERAFLRGVGQVSNKTTLPCRREANVKN